MADTWEGRIRELLAGTGAGEVFREGEDVEGAAYPYATVHDPVVENPALRGDASTLGRLRQIDVHVWQDQDGYDPQLPERVRDALDGARADGHRLTVLQLVRVPQPAGDPVAHHTCTVQAGVVL